ncbi:MAG: CocE/NonD family hydrolase [Aeromicrobium sp.]
MLRHGFARLVMAVSAVPLVLGSLTFSASPSAAASPAWEPGPTRYGVAERSNVPITMSDGTILRANVYYPTDPASGEGAEGPFPTVLTMTPYGKDKGDTDPALGQLGMGRMTYLVERGYLHAVVDVRGTGASGGSWSFSQPVEAEDGATLVDWAAELPQATGAVGMIGQSYGAIDQLTTAAAVGPGSPLKAILPIVPSIDVYRDAFAPGGVTNPLLPVIYTANALTSYANAIGSLVGTASTPQDLADLVPVLLQHLGSFSILPVADLTLGGPQAFDTSYWRDRAPGEGLDDIVANDVPTLVLGGWKDVFQRAAPLIYAGLQNASAGRPVDAPMIASQRISSKYQLIEGPWYHGTIGQSTSSPRLRVEPIALRWFDRWLKNEASGADRTDTPFRSFDLTTRAWRQTARYPFAGTTPTKLYLGAAGSLATSGPTASGSDQVGWSNVPLCTPSITQHVLIGSDAQAAEQQGLPPGPCNVDDRPVQGGPSAVTYTSAPMTAPTTIAGPVAARIFATATTTDTQWVVRVEDVAPDGASAPLSRGVLLGSLRSLDASRTWRAPDGSPTRPYHPLTESSSIPVVPGLLTRYDIEVPAVHATVPAGHRIRVTIGTNDSPSSQPTVLQTLRLLGGVYQIHRDPAAASYVQLPLSTTPVGAPCTDTLVCP